MSEEARNVFESLQSYSYIVQTDERRQINSDNKVHVYQLNTILYPKYELAIGKRGLVSLTSADAELFFNLSLKEQYDKFVSEEIKSYNFPFNLKSKQTNLLFDIFD